MKTFTSFADLFRPRGRAPSVQAASVSYLPGAGLAGAGGGVGGGREMRLSREQARHCRLWNFIAIDANATKAAEDVPHVGYVAADGTRIPDPRHPLAQLFRDVNPVDWWQSFAHEMYLMWGLFRRVVIWMNPNGFGLPAELWVIPTTWAEPVVDRAGTVTGWRITPAGDGGGGRVSGAAPFEIDADEILCAQAKHPTSKSIPLSPTEAGAEWIVSSEIIERARSRTYENGPLQSVLLEIDPEHHQGVTPELMEAIGEKFMARYQGWHQAGRPIVQPPGVRAVPWSVKPSEMLTGEQADQLRDNVLALHRTPRSAVGISSDLNRASIWGAEHNWYEHALNPMRRFLAGALTEFLASRFESGLTVWYDDLVPRDQENERAEVELDFRLGAITPDERRRARGYDPLGIPESQKPYRQASLVPLDTPVQPGTPKEFSTRPERDEDGTGGSGDEEDDPAAAAAAGDFCVRSDEPGPEDGGRDDGGEAGPASGAVRGVAGAGVEACQVHAACGAARRRMSHGLAEKSGDGAGAESLESDEPDAVATALAEDFEQTHARGTELLVRRASEFFRLLANEIEARVDAGALVAEDLCPDAIVRTGFQTALTPGWRGVAELGIEFERRSLARGERADRIAQAAKRTKNPGGGKRGPSRREAADETAPRVRRQIDEWIAEQQESEWKHVARATRREIAAAVKEGIAEGVTAKVLKSRLRRIVTDAGRAKGLAETEATKGLNKGAQLHRDAKGIRQKQWVSRGGSRSTHAAAHGQVTGNDGVFTVGGYRMKHPGDTSLGAPAAEVARCRCFATGKIQPKRDLKRRNAEVVDRRGMTVYPNGAILKNWLGKKVRIPAGHTMSLRDPPMNARPILRRGGLADPRGFTDAEREGFLDGNDGGTRVTPHHRHQIAVRDGGVLDELPRNGHPEGNVHLRGRPTRHPNDRRGGRNGTVFHGPGGEKLHRDEVRKFFQAKGHRLVRDPETGLWVDPMAH